MLNEEISTLLLRNEPLGTDRELNKYFWFGTQEYVRVGVPPEESVTPFSFVCVFIQSYDRDSTTEHWYYYPPSEIPQVISQFQVKPFHYEERKLMKALESTYSIIRQIDLRRAKEIQTSAAIRNLVARKRPPTPDGEGQSRKNRKSTQNINDMVKLYINFNKPLTN